MKFNDYQHHVKRASAYYGSVIEQGSASYDKNIFDRS